MIVFPNAKINLGLHITGKLPDGYHSLETVFYPVPWCDILEVMENKDHITGASKVNIALSGLSVDGDPEKNLCFKAYHLLDAEFNLPPVNVFLHKQIPMGAGLGGGSSDAAFMLNLLNNLFDLRLSKTELAIRALKLGADCAFFIENQACYATGKGEELTHLDVTLKGNYIVIIKPPVHISTAYAYSKVKPQVPSVSLKQIISSTENNWKAHLKNDFEPFIFPENPAIEKIKNMLYSTGAWYASMSGSGSAVYGLFKGTPPEIILNDCLVWSSQLP